MKLKDFKNDGDQYEVRGYVKRVEQKMGKRGPYVTVTFTDGDTETFMNAWVPKEQFPWENKVVDMTILLRNGYMNCARCIEAVGADVSVYAKTAPADPAECFDYIHKTAESFRSTNLRDITLHILDKYKYDFKKWAAGKALHHAYRSGLVYHVYRMLKSAKGLAGVYDGLDKDLLFAGIILHDIGKLREMDTDELGTADYTLCGNLMGHLYLGANMLQEAIATCRINPEDEELLLLQHMILSHHGKQEFGSVRTPSIPEAFLLFKIDEIDSRMTMMEEELAKMEPGTIAKANPYMDNMALYKKK